MIGSRCFGMVALLAGLGALAAWQMEALGQQQKAADPRADITKKRVELPVEKLVGGNPAAPQPAAPPKLPPRVDKGKLELEAPTKAVVKEGTAVATPPGKESNPKVEPGLVKWHKDFAAACEASKISGKPVLLFHMMGELDRQFC